MSIVPKKQPAAPAAAKTAAFIAGAPDAGKSVRRLGGKAIISLSLDPEVLARVDAWSAGQGLSRAAAITLAINKLVTAS